MESVVEYSDFSFNYESNTEGVLCGCTCTVRRGDSSGILHLTMKQVSNYSSTVLDQYVLSDFWFVEKSTQDQTHGNLIKRAVLDTDFLTVLEIEVEQVLYGSSYSDIFDFDKYRIKFVVF